MSLSATMLVQLVFFPPAGKPLPERLVDLGATQDKPMWRPLPTSTGFFFVPWLLANPRVSSWKAAECDGKGTELGIRRGVLVLNTAPQDGSLCQELSQGGPASLSKVVYVGAWTHGTCEFCTGLSGLRSIRACKRE